MVQLALLGTLALRTLRGWRRGVAVAALLALLLLVAARLVRPAWAGCGGAGRGVRPVARLHLRLAPAAVRPQPAARAHRPDHRAGDPAARFAHTRDARLHTKSDDCVVRVLRAADRHVARFAGRCPARGLVAVRQRAGRAVRGADVRGRIRDPPLALPRLPPYLACGNVPRPSPATVPPVPDRWRPAAGRPAVGRAAWHRRCAAGAASRLVARAGHGRRRQSPRADRGRAVAARPGARPDHLPLAGRGAASASPSTTARTRRSRPMCSICWHEAGARASFFCIGAPGAPPSRPGAPDRGRGPWRGKPHPHPPEPLRHARRRRPCIGRSPPPSAPLAGITGTPPAGSARRWESAAPCSTRRCTAPACARPIGPAAATTRAAASRTACWPACPVSSRPGTSSCCTTAIAPEPAGGTAVTLEVLPHLLSRISASGLIAGPLPAATPAMAAAAESPASGGVCIQVSSTLSRP